MLRRALRPCGGTLGGMAAMRDQRSSPQVLGSAFVACRQLSAAPGNVHGGAISSDGAVSSIVIDNPTKRNAMTLAMYRAVPPAAAAAAAGGARVCILRGAGEDAFGAGSDITEFKALRSGAAAAAAYSATEDRATAALLDMPLPLLAAIHGPCMGGGLNLALAADVRYAADDAVFAVPPAKLGIGYPPALMELLLEAVGRSAALELLFTGRAVRAEEALRIGLVDAVLPKAELDAHVDGVAASVSRLAPLTLRAAKLAAWRRAGAVEACAACYESRDYAEGIAAFEEKRRPTFEGR